MFDFSGANVLVTGASRGIGLAVATAFASCGANLTLIADDEDIIDAAGSVESETGILPRCIQCDISDREQVAKSFDALDRIDVLINNAGIEALTPIDEQSRVVEDRFRRVIDVNVVGTYYVTREAVTRMSDGGRIIFTASVAGKTGIPLQCAYSASRHATLGLMRSLASELGERGITVNAVCPGEVNTETATATLDELARQTGRDVADLVQETISEQALRGHMQPDDIAGVYLFLASDLAQSVTGHALSVDRGSLMV